MTCVFYLIAAGRVFFLPIAVFACALPASPPKLFILLKAVEPRAFGERLFLRFAGGFCGDADGQVAHQLIVLRHAEHIRHFAADVVLVRDLPFNPAALVAQRDGGKQDVFDCGGVVLHKIGAVAVGDDAPREHENHRGCGSPDVRFGEVVELAQQGGIVHGDQARGLLVAAGGRGKPRLQQLPEVFARDGGWGVFAAVAGAGEDGGEGWHISSPGFLFNYINREIHLHEYN